MRNYMKKREEKLKVDACKEVSVSERCFVPKFGRKSWCIGSVLLLIPILIVFCARCKDFRAITISDAASIEMASVPIAAVSTKKGAISIPSGTVKANPFVPYREIGGKSKSVNDVPEFVLVEPPAASGGDSDAVRIMDTTVSGILFDKYSPSAILNIEGNDYLVKKGDVVNNYHVVAIKQDSVTVSLGSNVYTAGIGEILTEGTLNHNNVSNLDNKFGGVK